MSGWRLQKKRERREAGDDIPRYQFRRRLWWACEIIQAMPEHIRPGARWYEGKTWLDLLPAHAWGKVPRRYLMLTTRKSWPAAAPLDPANMKVLIREDEFPQEVYRFDTPEGPQTFPTISLTSPI